MAAAAEVSDDGDDAVLRDDERGIPRSLRLLAALVEADALRHAAAVSRPAESDLVRAFRGGSSTATPAVPIAEFLERIHNFIQLESVRHVIQLRGTSYVLAGIYLTRFMHSAAAMEAGIVVEPSTAHRLVAVALFLGAKFGGPDDRLPKRWTVVFEISSNVTIRAREMADLEKRFLRAVDFRLFVDSDEFEWFCRILEQAPNMTSGSGRKRTAAADAEGEGDDESRRVQPCLPPPSMTSGGGRKRTAAADVEGEGDDESRRVRPCLPPPAVVAN